MVKRSGTPVRWKVASPPDRRVRLGRAAEEKLEQAMPARQAGDFPEREERQEREEHDQRPPQDLVGALARKFGEARGERLSVDETFDDVLENGESRDEGAVGDRRPQHREDQRPPGDALPEPYRLADEDHLPDDQRLDQRESVPEVARPELVRDQPPVRQEGAEEDEEVGGDQQESLSSSAAFSFRCSFLSAFTSSSAIFRAALRSIRTPLGLTTAVMPAPLPPVGLGARGRVDAIFPLKNVSVASGVSNPAPRTALPDIEETAGPARGPLLVEFDSECSLTGAQQPALPRLVRRPGSSCAGRECEERLGRRRPPPQARWNFTP